MLKPQSSLTRDLIDCSGLWGFKADPKGVGEEEGWQAGFDSELELAIPGSWNEQLQEAGYMNYVGGAWLQTRVFIPMNFVGKQIFLRFGSAEFEARVWVNGEFSGENHVLFLPFEFQIDECVDVGKWATIVVWVSNSLTAETITQEVTLEHYEQEKRIRDELFPAVRFDFFPYGGLHRPVLMSAIPEHHIADAKVITRVTGSNSGDVSFNIGCPDIENACVSITLVDTDWQQDLQQRAPLIRGQANLSFSMENCRLWQPSDPYLYTAHIGLHVDDKFVDQYFLTFGVREIKVDGHQLLLNDKPIFLRGFGKHEDSPISGKGLNLPQMVKDFGLLKWINANSFRTSHYPYAEEVLEYADRKGVLIISEIPSINLDFRKVNETTFANHKLAIERQFARDYNHPSVIMWSLANEPGFLNEAEYQTESPRYWQTLFEYAKQLDDTRPMMVANVLHVGSNDPVFEYADVVAINRYYGWYQEPGQLDRAFEALKKELDFLAEKHKKPIIVSEFGADTLVGQHSTSEQMFTEEYQADLIKGYCQIIEANPYCVGEHVWNFADFRTSQHFRRVILNLKGVFTRNREPKRAAFTLRELWSRPYQKPQSH